MSIIQNLEQILSARYGRDVRQAIHDSIEEGYNIAVQAEGKATTAQDSAQASANASAQSSASALQSAQLAEQYKNEAFSGTPTGYEALVEKVNSIYKETASHYAIVGSSEGSALAHTIYGMSKQDGVPTPDNPVDIESAVANFKCVGKNLISRPYYRGNSYTTTGITYTVNSDGSVTANGTSTGEADYHFAMRSAPSGSFINNLKSGTYYIGFEADKPVANDVSFQLNGYTIAGSGNVVVNVSSNTSTTFTFDSTSYIHDDTHTIGALIYVPRGITLDNVTFKCKLYLAGVANTDFEPYKETEVTTDLTLRALEVPQNSGYNLVKDGKYYIADTVDWSEDEGYQITRRIGYQVGGTVGWYGLRDKSKQLNIVLDSPIYNEYSSAKMNRFVQDYTHSLITGTFWFGASRTVLCIFLPTSMDITSVQSAQTWIDNNPTEIVYRLDTPTTEPITSQQAQALLSLKTYDEATSIVAESDIEPTMILEYSKDRNTALALTGHNVAHKNALKIAELNTALMEFTAGQEA